MGERWSGDGRQGDEGTVAFDEVGIVEEEWVENVVEEG